jgi:hypothetical protein
VAPGAAVAPEQIMSAFLVALGISLVSFTLFGCYCWNGVRELPKLQPIDEQAPAVLPKEIPPK